MIEILGVAGLIVYIIVLSKLIMDLEKEVKRYQELEKEEED